jgi:hypothetical protein
MGKGPASGREDEWNVSAAPGDGPMMGYGEEFR